MRRSAPFWLPAAAGIALAAELVAQPVWPAGFAALLGPPYAEPLGMLALNHLLLVLASVGLSTLLAVGAAVGVTREAGRALRPAAETLVAAGQTLPPVAVLALAIPAIGFGFRPALIALTLYALLPIFQAALAGLDAVPRSVREAADGTGFGPVRRLLAVELPLALDLILAGLRTAVAINVGTAAIASTAGVRTLGTPIIVGLDAGETGAVLQGALAVALLAILLDSLLARAAERLSPAPA